MLDAMTDDPYHYRVIGRALREIEASHADRPSLDAIAERVGLSPAHFQRVFTKWVGVSPKRYQQYLTLDLSRQLLRDRFTVLDTAAEAGLSGTGRLHDLFVKWEAMTPGEFAQGTAMRWGRFDTPFGPAIATGTDRGLSGLAFHADTTEAAALDDLTARWPQARFAEDPEPLRPWVEAAWGGGETRLHLIGAPFQLQVWEALLRIPSGMVSTYGEIARAVGRPKAARAVGTAVGRNPVSFLVPCHRAIRGSGALGGYHWGLPVKRAILAWETAQRDAVTQTDIGA